MNLFIHNIVKPRHLVLGLGLIAASAPTFAQGGTAPVTAPAVATDPAAKALFDQTIERYKSLKDLTLVVDRGGRNQLVKFKAPQSLRVTPLDGKGDLLGQVQRDNSPNVQLYTDKEIVMVQKPNDTYEWVSTPRPDVPAGEDARVRLATLPVGGTYFPSLLAGLDPFRAGARYEASAYTFGPATPIITPVVVTIAKTDKQPLDIAVTFNINKKTQLVQSIQSKTTLPNGRVVESVDRFKVVQADTNLPDSTFAFSPPAGATKVATFSRPTVRAVLGQTPLPLNSKDIVGQEINFDQYKGKVVLVDFWATWCGPCIGELPNVKANYEKYKDQGFDVLGISLDQSTTPLTKFIKEKEMPWRQVFDGYWDGPIATGFNVRAIPSTILIGKDGKIAAIGARGEQLEPAIKAALAAQ